MYLKVMFKRRDKPGQTEKVVYAINNQENNDYWLGTDLSPTNSVGPTLPSSPRRSKSVAKLEIS